MTAIPVCGSTSGASASGPAWWGGGLKYLQENQAVCAAQEKPIAPASVDVPTYINWLRLRSEEPRIITHTEPPEQLERLLLVPGPDDAYWVFDDQAKTVASAVPGVLLSYGKIDGRPVACVSINVEILESVLGHLYLAGHSIGIAEGFGSLVYTRRLNQRPAPLDYVDGIRKLQRGLSVMPRSIQVLAAKLNALDGDAQRLAIRSIVAWLRNFDRHPMDCLSNDVRPGLPARAALAGFAELLTMVPADRHAAAGRQIRRVISAMTGDSPPSHLRLSHGADEADDVAACEGVPCGA